MNSSRYSLFFLIAAFTAALFMSLPAAANTVVDGQGTVWSVVREFNKSTGGWDLRLTVDGDSDRAVWVTEDPVLDQDPVIALDPLSGKPVIYWSRLVGAEFRIFRSAFLRGGFSEPVAVTAGGSGFSDTQPFVQYDGFGRCHLVWYRQRPGSGGAAFYACRTGVSWSAAEQISLQLDNVVGTVTIAVSVDEESVLNATYQYFSATTGTTGIREVCRGGDTSPWCVCH